MAKKKRNKRVSKQTWEELDEIYTALATSIVNITSSLRDSLNTIKDTGHNENKELISLVTTISEDVNEFTIDLKLIQSKHERYSGVVKDGDELALSISIFNDYCLLNDKFKTIIFTPMLTITEYLTDIKSELARKESLAPTMEISNE